MVKSKKNLLTNQALGLSVRITDERLRTAGVRVEKTRALRGAERTLKISPKLAKRLADA